MSKIEYPHNVVLKIEGNSKIDYEYVIENFSDNFNYMLEQKKSLFSRMEITIFDYIYKMGLDVERVAETLATSVDYVKDIDNGIIRKLKTPGCRKFIFVGKDLIEKYEDLRSEYIRRISNLENGMKPFSDDISIDCLELNNSTVLALKRNGIFTIGDAKKKIKTWTDLISLRGVGISIAENFLEKIHELGWYLEYE